MLLSRRRRLELALLRHKKELRVTLELKGDKMDLEFRGPAREIAKRAPLARMVITCLIRRESLVWTQQAGIRTLEK